MSGGHGGALDEQISDPNIVREGMIDLIEELYPICRSITGDGVRETLRRIGARVPIEIHEVPSGTEVFDWIVPREWNVRGGYIRDARGNTVGDFADSSLHVLNYSTPVHRTVELEELREHVFTLPEHPDWIPYRTSYYAERWGFCMSHRLLQSLQQGLYEVRIDSTLEAGHLTYGECVLEGEIEDEILVSVHVCHPSMCNDNLSGIAVATELAKRLAAVPRRHTFRFLFIPGTIGSITWLSRNEDVVPRIRHGLVLACVGDAGFPNYKRSRRGDAVVDRAVEHVLHHGDTEYGVEDFTPYGYDERQFCSPGFDLAVGCFMRTPHGRFAEYHTSADDLDFVHASSLEDTVQRLLDVVDVLEHARAYRSLNPKCEPQLGKRGLYDNVGGRRVDHEDRMALLWVLNQSDGSRDLLDIAERSGMPFHRILWAARVLREAELLQPA